MSIDSNISSIDDSSYRIIDSHSVGNFLYFTEEESFLHEIESHNELLAPGVTFPLSFMLSDQKIYESFPKTFALIKILQELLLSQDSQENRDSKIDTFILKLLNLSHFDQYPFVIYIKPLLWGLLNDNFVSVIPDQVIFTSNLPFIVCHKRKYDTFHSNYSEENQLLSEMLIAAQNNVNNSIFGIRIIETRFIFYTYFFMDKSFHRFPAQSQEEDSSDLNTLDYKDAQDRHIILQILINLRNFL